PTYFKANKYAQALSSIPAIVDHYMDNKLGEEINKAIQAHNFDCREEAQAEKREYIELVDLTKNVTKSLEVAVLTRSSSQPQSSYEAAATLSEFELTKILIDKMERNKSYDIADHKRELGVKTTETKIKTPPLDQTKSAHVEDPSHTVEDSGMQQDQEFITGDNDEQPADKEVTKADWFKKPKRPPIPDPDWNHRGRQIIPKDYFINNDLEYLKHGDLSRRYSTSVTKTKAATYELKWIKDLVPELNLTSSKDVYSRRRIITVTRLKIVKKYDYGHLEEIEVRRDDQKLYTFKKGDFKRLPLYDIEDLLLLLVQQKLTNLTIDERYDLNMALHMYTRRIVIQRLVKDLQLGVESYQKKLNLTKPDTYRSNLRNKTAYTSYSDPHGIIYVDQYKRKRLMHADELYKFRDGTLNDVRYALHNIAAGIRMEYPPMRKWSNLDKKKAWVMVQDMDKQLYQRRLMRNLEKFVGGRVYGNDLRLLERTI
ncbi:hypothetical protein Tco_1380338, partial [Tanacetum coccineum]